MMRLAAFDPSRYAEQLEQKHQSLQAEFAALKVPSIAVFASPPEHFRMRAEFRIWHEGDDSYYAMFDPEHPREPVRVDAFPIATRAISDLMQPLLAAITAEPALRFKLFQIEFLATLTGQVLVTLIYHRRLESEWETAAQQLEAMLKIAIIGRSKGQRLVLSQDYVDESLTLHGQPWHFRQPENAFTQPNAEVCRHMIEWMCQQAQTTDVVDLLELYCGIGTFTLPLSKHFNRVLATELSRTAIAAAQFNQSLNQIENVAIGRISAEDFTRGWTTGTGRRMQAWQVDQYNFTSVFVDPPRAGLDPQTLGLVKEFKQILYMSCNPSTLFSNLENLSDTHDIASIALFDQFPYTPHREVGVMLTRK
jgi:tRNA (uracil-5-)-methyltransferase